MTARRQRRERKVYNRNRRLPSNARYRALFGLERWDVLHPRPVWRQAGKAWWVMA